MLNGCAYVKRVRGIILSFAVPRVVKHCQVSLPIAGNKRSEIRSMWQPFDIALFQNDFHGAVIDMQQRFYSLTYTKLCSFSITVNKKRIQLKK